MRVLVAAVSIAFIAACSSSNAPVPLGALDGAIVAGQNQSVVAGAPRLPDGVVEQIVRMPLTGSVQVRRVHPWERVFLPRLAWAQDVVKGSPVPGAIVCAYEGDVDLIPFSRCTNSGVDGKAVFFFSPTTKAGNPIARINGTVTNGDKVEATTFDTVKATVLPDIPNANYRSPVQALQCSAAVIRADGVQDKYGNAVSYRVVSDKYLTAQDTAIGSVGARTVTYTTSTDSSDNRGTITRYFTTELRGAGDALVGYLNYRIGGFGSCGNGQSGMQFDHTTGGSAIKF